MSGFLLDTNILSELRESRTAVMPGCATWFEGAAAEELFVSVLVLGEIRQGIERIRLRDQAQARALEKWLRWISTEFADRLLPVDERVADQWGRLGLRQPVPAPRRLPGGDGTRSRPDRGHPRRGRRGPHRSQGAQSILGRVCQPRRRVLNWSTTGQFDETLWQL